MKDISHNEKKELIKKYIKEIKVRFVNNAYFIKIIYNKIDSHSFFLIDINYNIIFDYPYRKAIGLSEKTQKMNTEETFEYAREILNDFIDVASDLKSPIPSDYDIPDKYIDEANQHIDFLNSLTLDYELRNGLED